MSIPSAISSVLGMCSCAALDNRQARSLRVRRFSTLSRRHLVLVASTVVTVLVVVQYASISNITHVLRDGASSGGAAVQAGAHDGVVVAGTTDDVVPLPLLTRSSEAAATACPRGLVPVLDTVLPAHVTHPPSRNIPRVVHVTSKDRCVGPAVRAHLEQWRGTADHAFFFHDDDAVRRLLRQGWVDRTFRTGRGRDETCPGENYTRHHPPPKYARKTGCSWEPAYLPDRPASDVALGCATTGATLADLWRYAVLYRYGGIYTDIDNSKGPLYSDDLIKDDDDFVGTMEKLGIIGQYWLASSPGHPYLRHTMDDALSQLRVSPNVMKNQPEKRTGPGAVKRGFCFFMEAGGNKTSGYVEAGTYVGDQNRSVTVIGSKGSAKAYVNRDGLGSEKLELYRASNMTHFSDAQKIPAARSASIPSCEEHLERSEGHPVGKASYI